MTKPWNSPSRTLLASALAGLWSSPLWAADESVYFSDLPVVASVSRLPQRLADAPTAVTVVDREMIKASGVRNLNDVFRLVPGFQTYPHNTEPARVSYHGLNDEDYSPRVQVLIDGRSMYSPLFGNGVNWATIPVALEDIERIEVVRGTNSVSYGSNAFLGVINIITVDPALTHGLSVSASHGSQNVRDQGLRLGGRIGEVGDFRLTYRQQNDDGLNNRGNWVDDFQSRLVDFRSDLALGQRDSLQLNFGQAVGRLRVGRSDATELFPGQSNSPLRPLVQKSTHFQTQWNRTLSSGAELKVRYAYVVDQSNDDFYLVAPWQQTFHLNQSGDRGTRQDWEIQHSFPFTSQMRLVWGGAWRKESMRSDWNLPNQGEVRREVYRLFGNVEWKPVEAFTANLGFSGERDSLAGYHPATRVSGNWHLNSENTIRIGYAQAYRTGSIFDYRGDYRLKVEYGGNVLYDRYVFAADRELRPERMDAWELGYLGGWRAWRASLDVRLFQEKIRDRLYIIDRDVSNVTGNSIPSLTTPIQDVRIRGIEYQFKWQPFEPTRLVFSQTFTDIDSDYLASALAYPSGTLSSPDAYRNIEALTERSTPRRATSLLWMQSLPYRLQFSLAGYWQDKMKWSANSRSASYHRFDARLAYPFRLAGVSAELAYVVQSLNGSYSEYKTYDGSGNDPEGTARIVDRRQWLTLRLDY